MSAKAPTYDILYDFESQIEEAFSDVLDEKTAIGCYTQRSNQDLTTPRYEFQFTNGAATGKHGRAKDGFLYPDGWSGTLRARLITERKADVSFTAHRQSVAKLRRYIAQFETFITEENLPYLDIESVMETGSSQGIDEDQKHDITELSFLVGFYIRPNAWPDV